MLPPRGPADHVRSADAGCVPDDVRAEVARVLALGATVLDDRDASPGRSDTVGG
jgi:hypothetical protein